MVEEANKIIEEKHRLLLKKLKKNKQNMKMIN
jgi:hypothetical protein